MTRTIARVVLLTAIFFAPASSLATAQGDADFLTKVYTKSEMEATLARQSAVAVCRDDSVSLALQDLVLGADRDGKFMVEVDLTLHKKDPNTGANVAPMVFRGVLGELVEVRKAAPRSLAPKGGVLLEPQSLTQVDRVDLQVFVTPVADPTAFDGLAGLYNTMISSFNIPAVVKPLLDVHEENLRNDGKQLAFSASFWVPQNFLEYAKAQDENIATMSTDGPIAISLDTSISRPPDTNTFKGIWEEVKNNARRLIASDKVKTDTSDVKGLVTVTFTKSLNPVIPTQIRRRLDEVADQMGDDRLDDATKTLSDLKTLTKGLAADDLISRQLEKSVVLFCRLAEVRIGLSRAQKADVGAASSAVLERFAGVTEDLVREAQNYGWTNFVVSGIYPDRTVTSQGAVPQNEPQGAVFILPYALTNDAILVAYHWEETLHDYTAQVDLLGKGWVLARTARRLH